jgi:hypothetical protein
MSSSPCEASEVLPLIKRGDLDHYRHLANHADMATLRALVLVMADDLEEALDAACPIFEEPSTGRNHLGQIEHLPSPT